MIKEIKRLPLDFSTSIPAREKREAELHLKSEVEQIVGEHFSDMAHKTPPIEINNRLKSCYGRFWEGENKIDIAGVLVKAYQMTGNISYLRKILKHELAHWYLCKKGEPFDDGDVGFEELLVQIDSFSSGATSSSRSFAPRIHMFGFMVVVECEKCGATFYESRRTRTGVKTHKKCGGRCPDVAMALVESVKE